MKISQIKEKHLIFMIAITIVLLIITGFALSEKKYNSKVILVPDFKSQNKNPIKLSLKQQNSENSKLNEQVIYLSAKNLQKSCEDKLSNCNEDCKEGMMNSICKEKCSRKYIECKSKKNEK